MNPTIKLLKKSLAAALSLSLISGQALAATTKGVPPSIPGAELPAATPVIPALGAPLALDAAAGAAALAAPSALAQPDLSGLPAKVASGLKAVPVKVAIPAAELEKLSPAQRQDAQAMARFAEARLFTWEKFAVELPGTVFDGAKGQLISVGDLFQAPTSDEVGEIGRSDGGQGPRLTPEQKAEIARTGRFTVPSVRHAGLSHVWQLARWLQKGREAISATRRGHNAGALEQLTVQIPNRVNGESAPSLRNAAKQLGRGLYESASLLAGLKSERPRYHESEVEARVESALLERLRANAKEQGLDGRLYDDKLMEKAGPLALAAAEKSSEAFSAKLDEHRAEAERIAREAGIPEDKLPQAVADGLQGLANQALFESLVMDAKLEALSPGLGSVLARNGFAQSVARFIEATFEESLRESAEKLRAELSAKHPVRALVPGWLDGEVEAAVSAQRASERRALEFALVRAVAEQGLFGEAVALGAELDFIAHHAPALRAQLGAERVPVNSFRHDRRFWLAKSWIIEKQESEGRTYYSVAKHRTFSTTTQDLAWRVQNGIVRTAVWWNNALFHLLVSNLWNGPLGAKSLLFYSEFKPDWSVDQKTGTLVRTGENGTMLSRIRALWAHRRDILKKFDADKDYGFLGRDVRRFFMFFTVDLFHGVFLPAMVLLFQPTLTVLNLAFAALALATSILWAPAVALLNWAFNAVVYDTDRGASRPSFVLPKNWLPLVDRVAGQLAFGAALQTLVSLVAVPVHALWAGVQAGFGLLRTAARESWDFLMRGVIGWRGRVPPRDYRGFLRRIAGPGLTAEHYFQVPPALALVALQAQLESGALSLYAREAAEAVKIPVANHGLLMEALGAALGGAGGGRRGSPSYQEIGAAEEASTKALSAAVREREKLLGLLLSVPSRERIKLAKADHEATLKKAVVVTRIFTESYFKVQGWGGPLVARFWKDAGLAAGDWEGLAKANLASVFGSGFLTPLEDADKSFKIEVQTPGLSDYAEGIEKGIVPEDLRDVVLTGGQERRVDPVMPRVPEAGRLILRRTHGGEAALFD